MSKGKNFNIGGKKNYQEKSSETGEIREGKEKKGRKNIRDNVGGAILV